MGYKIIYTKSFHGNLRKVLKDNKQAGQAVRAAMTEAATDGIISLPRTKHGESRIQNVEKYDLHDAYRLIVQLVDGKNKTRAFLFVGDHADSERWLDSHKNYKWVKNNKDGSLEFTLVTNQNEGIHIPADRFNYDLCDDENNKPLLECLSDMDWEKISISPEGKKFVLTITGAKYDEIADDVLDKLYEIIKDYEKCSLIFDLMWLAHEREWEGFKQRMSIIHDKAHVVDESIVAVLSSSENTDSLITFDDNNLLSEFENMKDFSDWMLFLHPEQKNICERDFSGPVRLRGVSGSGKTSVLVHRARRLAKKYESPILLVTLTKSLSKLLERLVNDLCGIERRYIEIKTMSSLAMSIYNKFYNESMPLAMIQRDQKLEILREISKNLSSHEAWGGSKLASFDAHKLNDFLSEELSYVRGRLKESELVNYLDSKLFQRIGRGIPLEKNDRAIIYSGIMRYIEKLKDLSLFDHERIVSTVLDEISSKNEEYKMYRSILVDEVQDLSELDLSLISSISSTAGEKVVNIENGLFITGDAAQSIYKKGFSLRKIGIDIKGRSFTLKKNYRNTYEILNAAFGFIRGYEFLNIGEENIEHPHMPDFASRHGAKPIIIRCDNLNDEARMIADDIQSLLEMGQYPGQICIIGPSFKAREEMSRVLKDKCISFVELKQDINFEGNDIKISTIESAKGHEFSAVYIMDLMEGVLPLSISISHEDIIKDASRFYVAMTRAREKLIMSYNLNGTASRFLKDVQPYCTEANMSYGKLHIVSDES